VINPIQTRTADRLQAPRCRTPRLVALSSSVRGPWPTSPGSKVRTGPGPNGALPRASGLAGGDFLGWWINPSSTSPRARGIDARTWCFPCSPFVGGEVYRSATPTKAKTPRGPFVKSSWFFGGSRMGELILHAPMCPMADSSVRVIIASKSISRMSGHGMLATQPAQVSDFIQTRFGPRS
jgi:hypothetical protein